MELTKYTHRHIARITVEAMTPIAVGTGDNSIITDAPVIKDINGLPFIPATSIAGVMRHALKNEEQRKRIFGYQSSINSEGQGSMVIYTDAIMLGKEGIALDGIQCVDWDDELYAAYASLPVRQHVRIGQNGTTERTGKFDNEVVYKGTRFVFELELISDVECNDIFSNILEILYKETFRLGCGTRCGYGKVKVVKCQKACLNLEIAEDLKTYLSKSSSLSEAWDRFEEVNTQQVTYENEGWTKYSLHLSPLDFFAFGSGMGDDDADNIPVSESIVTWEDNKPHLKKKQTLLPGSAIKGTLAHRTAYNYNKIKGFYVGNADAKSGEENEAVAQIFGRAKGTKAQRGNILIDDLIGGDMYSKLFCHIKTDYFTGGTVDGALFQEKSVMGRKCKYVLNIMVKSSALEDNAIREAFEHSLKDVCEGLLPLGGITNRGNGIFMGELHKNDIAL